MTQSRASLRARDIHQRSCRARPLTPVDPSKSPSPKAPSPRRARLRNDPVGSIPVCSEDHPIDLLHTLRTPSKGGHKRSILERHLHYEPKMDTLIPAKRDHKQPSYPCKGDQKAAKNTNHTPKRGPWEPHAVHGTTCKGGCKIVMTYASPSCPLALPLTRAANASQASLSHTALRLWGPGRTSVFGGAKRCLLHCGQGGSSSGLLPSPPATRTGDCISPDETALAIRSGLLALPIGKSHIGRASALGQDCIAPIGAMQSWLPACAPR